MRETRPEIACGIDRVTGGAAERETDGPDDHADEGRGEAFVKAAAGHEIRQREDCEHAEDEHEGADDLSDEVGRDEVPREFAYIGKAYGDRKAVNSSLQAHVFAAMNGCPS